MVWVSREKDDSGTESSVNEKYVLRKMEVKAVEETKAAVPGGREDIKELKGRNSKQKPGRIIYFCYLFSAQKLLPNKRLYNSD